MTRMTIGLVSYTYHRYLGDPYLEVQSDPGIRWTMLDVVRKAAEFGLEGVVLDTNVMPSLDKGFLSRSKSSSRRRWTRHL